MFSSPAITVTMSVENEGVYHQRKKHQKPKRFFVRSELHPNVAPVHNEQ